MQTIYIYNTDQYLKVINNEMPAHDIDLLDTHTDFGNKECEEWAAQKNYNDPDLFAWSYTNLACAL